MLGRAARPGRLRPDAVPAALRRPAAAARPGDGGGRPSRAGLRRRADRRAWTRRRGGPPGSCSSELRADGVTVVLTTHYMDEAERLADRIHIIDRGRLIATGTPLELTRGGAAHDPAGRHRAVPPGRAGLAAGGPRPATEVTPSSTRSACWSPARPTPRRWRRSPRWCEEHGVLPESLTLGQRNLEDVFLELTGRELAAMTARHLHPDARRGAAAPAGRSPRRAMEARLMLRNGEQLLLAVVIPVIVLSAASPAPGTLDLEPRPARRRRAHPRRARAGGDVDGVHLAGDRDRLRAPLRRHQAARRLAAPRGPACSPARSARCCWSRCSRSSSSARSRSRWAGTRTPRSLVAAVLASCCSAPPRSPRSACSRRRRCAPRRPWPRRTWSTCCCWPAAPWCCPRRRTAASATSPRLAAVRCARRGDARGALIDGRLAWRDLAVLARLGRGRHASLTARTFKWE